MVFAAEHDIFFPARLVLPSARKIIKNLAAAEQLDGAHHFITEESKQYVADRLEPFFSEEINPIKVTNLIRTNRSQADSQPVQ